MGIVTIKSHMNNKTHKKFKSEQQKINDDFSKMKMLLKSPQPLPLKPNPPFHTVSHMMANSQLNLNGHSSMLSVVTVIRLNKHFQSHVYG